MDSRSIARWGRRHPWVLGLALLPMAGWAQTADADASKAWRQANDLVGQFRRGHADLLKWEQSQENASKGAAAASPVNTLDLSSAESAVELAWKVHPELAGTLDRLGSANRALVIAGRWTELDPALSWKLEGLDEVIDLAVAARKAWLQATASQLALAPMQLALDAAQAAQELGQRMVAVGNWSKLAQAPQQLAWANARLNWQRAQYAAAQDRARLLRLLQLSGRYAALRLPPALPAVPDRIMDDVEFNERLRNIQNEVPALRRERHRSAAQLAYQAYLGSHAVALVTQNEIAKVRDQVLEDTQLHYSGMLKSTWELLGEVQNQAQTRVALIGSQRDFSIAALDLNWALFAGEPESLTALGSAAADAAPSAH